MNKRLLNLQLFAAPENMTGKAQIQTKAREIDFVTSFSKNIQDLLDILSISRMIKKANGTALKTKTTTGTLQSGTVGEGDEIPLSKYEVKETVYDSINIDKYRKAVSIEAIAEKGYDSAVESTDDEFKSDLQNVVLDKFYTQLKAGTLKSTEATWQMAIAMAIGKVKDKFKKMKRTATGVAVWVNTIDVYKYVGASDITIQTAFGMDYLENFMGADIVFISSEISEGNVIATPLNNIIGYYVDPADSEFAKAGLSYTTDSTTGILGFHSEGNYGRALSESFAIMGIRLFAEYLDAIANITIDLTPTLETLMVTSAAGTATGATKLSVSPAKEDATDVYKYKAGEVAVSYGQNVKSWTAWDGESDINAVTGSKITIVEADADFKAMKSGVVTVTAKA